MAIRNIVSIDEALCNGCGACVIPCAEGAIELVGGKALVLKEELCDGTGFCLGLCPTGALSIEEREAPAFDHQATQEVASARGRTYIPQGCFQCRRTKDQVVLLPCRTKGESTWVCTRCLPALIHG